MVRPLLCVSRVVAKVAKSGDFGSEVSASLARDTSSGNVKRIDSPLHTSHKKFPLSRKVTTDIKTSQNALLTRYLKKKNFKVSQHNNEDDVPDMWFNPSSP